MLVEVTDAETWDAFLLAHPQGHLLQSFAWGELKGAFGWEPLRLALVEGGETRAVAQVLFRRMAGVSLAYIPRGPVVDWADEEAVGLLLEGVARAGRARRVLFFKVEPNLPDTPEAHARMRMLGFVSARTVQPRSTIVVDLRPDEEAFLARMKPKTRYNIRLAGRRGVVVRPARGPEEVDLFYDLLRETARRDRFGIHTLDYYHALYRLFNQAGRGALLFAGREGETLAGLWVVAFGQETIYMYGASHEQGQRHMPTYLLQWEAMRWARAQGCTRYDLWGIPESVAQGEDPREHLPEKNVRDGLWGVYRFKQGFGGEVWSSVGAYDRPCRPWLYRVYRSFLGR